VKIGLQTILWGTTFHNMNVVAANARQLGYEGLEFAQTVDTLGGAAKLRQLLDGYDLHPVGLTGGSLRSRIEYAVELAPSYLCIDEWEEESVARAIKKGLRVGIHPHLYKTVATMCDAESYLREFPELGLILDTAHQYLADDNVLNAIKDHHNRILAIHLKDWSSRYGRSPFRYARGFCPLGTGELGDVLEDTIQYLIQSDFDGWLIVEQDTPYGNPMDSARISREWLKERGL
jgi:sugar phosphate isomerase/epimerase